MRESVFNWIKQATHERNQKGQFNLINVMRVEW
jgi:hypothetical protein